VARNGTLEGPERKLHVGENTRICDCARGFGAFVLGVVAGGVEKTVGGGVSPCSPVSTTGVGLEGSGSLCESSPTRCTKIRSLRVSKSYQIRIQRYW